VNAAKQKELANHWLAQISGLYYENVTHRGE